MPVFAALALALAALVTVGSACGAVVPDGATRTPSPGDARAALEQRIAELEATLGATPTAPEPPLSARFVMQQFVYEPAPAPAAGDTVNVSLCLQLFGRGDPMAGIPPSLTMSCNPIAVPADGAAARAIDAFIDDATFACWATAVPGVIVPVCWR